MKGFGLLLAALALEAAFLIQVALPPAARAERAGSAPAATARTSDAPAPAAVPCALPG